MLPPKIGEGVSGLSWGGVKPAGASVAEVMVTREEEEGVEEGSLRRPREEDCRHDMEVVAAEAEEREGEAAMDAIAELERKQETREEEENVICRDA